MLLSTPFPFPSLLSPHPSRLLRLSSSLSTLPPTISPSTHRLLPKKFHSQTLHATTRDESTTTSKSPPPPQPLPEWSTLIQNLTPYTNHPQFNAEDSFAVPYNLPTDFVVSVNACLSFARLNPNLLQLLSRKDIEIVIRNVYPFLFESGVDSEKKMNSFLYPNQNQNNDMVIERACLVDLMRFVLSYVYDPVGSVRSNYDSGQVVEASVRNILRQLDYESRGGNDPRVSSSMPEQFQERYGQNSMPLRQNIQMKRGDWICSKCTFMNFARNMNCLECNETRPKRQLAGGEWNCPQCDFFNYGKNVVCLRCDCRRPGEFSVAADQRFGSQYNNDILNNNSSARAPPMLQRMANAGTYEANNNQSVEEMGKNSGVPVGRHLDRILGRASEGSKSEYVPFNPLPSDMFSKPQNSVANDQATRSSHTPASTANAPMSSGNFSDSSPLSRKPINHIESKEDKEQAEKSERWFNKVAELHDVTDLASAISDEDFPEIMPMRKGENRFVVSKKKDRSLTSPQYKRRIAMEQNTSTTKFTPFVPFPPDYFANKNKVPETEESTAEDTNPSSSFATPEVQSAEKNTGVLDSGTLRNSAISSEIQQSKKASWDTSFSGNNVSQSSTDNFYRNPSGNSNVAPNDRWNDSRENGSGDSLENSRSSPLSPSGNLSRQFENAADSTKESWKGGFSGKSLEGSLVKEPDPLDMSEEAKAQRWFRRVAQIKDISELSQIPDEDFPSIMPMRKGVNRFVVSKRKTPLERRLTSPQYRRNLPIVSSEPVKEDKTDS